ncbi:hypothetical protein KKE45_03680 [Patescibacteria group bacterium]|nr:hypothetical protein [Patescibacteria group bacterium]
MKLDKFLSDTLRGIVSGVSDANKKLGKGQFVIYNIPENAIEFDVAVIVSEGKTEVVEGSLGAGFPGFIAKVLGKQSNSISDKSINRLKFRVKPRLKIE